MATTAASNTLQSVLGTCFFIPKFSIKTRCLRALTLICCIVSTANLHAQNYIVHLDKYGMKEGLSSRQVNSICKDSRGLLWIATPYGLNSYDGYNFKIYTQEKDSLPFNYINEVLPGEEGNIYLVGPAGDIALFNPLTCKSRLLSDEYDDFKHYIFFNTITDRRGVLYATTRVSDTVWIYSIKKGLIKKRLHFRTMGRSKVLG